MRLGVNTIATFLHSLKPRKLLSAPRKAYLPNIFARHNPHFAARAARVRASKIRVSGTASFTSTSTSTQHRRRRTRSLRRSTSTITAAKAIFPTQVPSFPQPPGAFACAAAPGDPSTPLGAQKVFFDELYKQRAVLMRAAEERQRQAEEDAEFMRLLAEDERKAQEALRKAEEEEAERLAEERRVEEELRTKEEEEKERRRRKKREAEERRQRRAAREERKKEQERLEREFLEQERLEQERREQERQHREWEEQEALRQNQSAAEQVTDWFDFYEEMWVMLRADVQFDPLAFCNIPWPIFGKPSTPEDITLVRVQEFLCHPQRWPVQSAGLVKSLRSEMLRWHPDKFNVQMLNKIKEGDREAALEAAGKVARFLTQLTSEMKGR